jgi:hypothetical protein
MPENSSVRAVEKETIFKYFFAAGYPNSSNEQSKDLLGSQNSASEVFLLLV